LASNPVTGSDKENERRILEFIQKKQTATNTLIAKEFSLQEKQVNEISHHLREDGSILFQQELHLSRGDLIMAKITTLGTTSMLETKPMTKTGQYNFERMSKAIEFASLAHAGEFRKGTTIPYIVHPLDVFSILLKNGSSEDLAIAGVLHDVLEDTTRTRKDIKKNFGDAVCSLVVGASENEELTKGISNEEKKKSWKLRKTQKIDTVRNSGRDLRLLICADKLANIRDLIEDQDRNGDAVWSKFNASKDQESWYYNEMASAMVAPGKENSDISDTPVYHQLRRCIGEVFGSKSENKVNS
jgi:(p)ppGpp synthase/HD superfamily hydrolase